MARTPSAAGSRQLAVQAHPVRMEDVARRAGVSTITVSRALRKPELVADATRRRIAGVIEELGYIPNLVAGSLATRRSRTIAAIVPAINSTIFGETVQGMSDVFREWNYQLLLGNSGYSAADETALVAAFLARRPEGVVLTGTTHTAECRAMLARARVPVVETWNVATDPIHLNVGFSNFEAARAMVHHLAGRGRRRIAFVPAPVAENDRAAGRLAGYRAAVGELGLPAGAALVRESTFGLRRGREVLAALMAHSPRPDAVFFANDVLAAGALLECRRRGWAVPEEVAIAGFDDQEIASEMMPALTTVRVPSYEIGRQAAHLLLGCLHSGRPPTPRPGDVVDVGFEIVQRAST